MLIDIAFRNYKSFKNETYFSMEATDTIAKEDNVVSVNNSLRVLKVGVIYGANASGKSNFMSMLFFLKRFIMGQMVVEKNDPLNLLYQPFWLSPYGPNRITEVVLRFVASNGQLYKYLIRYSRLQVMEERIYRYNGEAEQLICERVRSGLVVARVSFNPEIPSNEGLPTNIDVFKNASILTPFLSMDGGDISVVARYIANIQYDELFYMPNPDVDDRIDYLASWIGNDKEKKAKILSYLKLAKTGIEDFEIRKNSLTKKSNIYFIHKVYDDDHHEVDKKRFPYEMESDGTIKLLFYAIRAITALEEGSPLFVDEINESLHTQLTRELLKLFIDPATNPKGAQLITTMHDINLMDEKMLRRDQIWFVQKDEEGVSEMYSLADFRDVDENTCFSQWYMANRFGATPTSPDVKFTRHETTE